MMSRARIALDRAGHMFWSVYSMAAVRKPWIAIAVASLIVAIASAGIPRFHVDASGDSLLLESDVALGYYREIRERYGSDDFLVLTYTPKDDLFSDAALDRLQQLRDELASVEFIDNITSILDVPLFESPPADADVIADGKTKLRDPRTDIGMARDELRTSPLYRNRVLSPDGQTTAMQLDLEPSVALRKALRDRSRLLDAEASAGPGSELRALEQRIAELRNGERQQTAQAVAAVRTIIKDFRGDAGIHLGGLPMISTDMLSYIRHDLRVFGSSLLVVLGVVLAVFFRQPRWVALPLLVSGATILGMSGILGYLQWPVTVVSSNFVSLLLILTLSLNVHLAVRYRELSDSDADNVERVEEMVRSKFLPALLTAITTMVAFGSLTVAGIRPVIDFGWMMVIGIGLGFLLTFLLLPPCLVLLGPGEQPPASSLTDRFTSALRRLVELRPIATSAVYSLFALASVWGLTMLDTDNRFIDYFDDSTAIHEGMTFIDRKLGGTTPLDIVIDGPADQETPDQTDALPIPGEAGFAATSYWLDAANRQTAMEIHDFLHVREHIGSVLSLDTSLYVFRQLADSETLDSLTLSLVYNRMPDPVKQQLVAPYLSGDGDQVRFAARVYETSDNLDRNLLLEDIETHLTESVGIDADRVHLTGIFVLYNNVLDSLLGSQLSTAAAVSVAVLLMFAVAFRSLRVAAVAIVPNLLGAAMVLAVLGYAAIPLDIMTITIAAVAIGIGVDDTIHYVHRFRNEYESAGRYERAMRSSHENVGRAMFYTSITIVLGFSVLALSNFVPTVYFGLLTGLAMLIALIADLTLLPILLVKTRAFG